MNAGPEQRENQEEVKVDLQCLPSLCRGLYHRVAQKMGCDPSYVSRVARGERTSQAVSEALRAEIQLAWARASDLASGVRSGGRSNGIARDANGNSEGDSVQKMARRRAKAASA